MKGRPKESGILSYAKFGPYLVLDIRTGKFIPIINAKSAMKLACLTALIQAQQPLSNTDFYKIVPKLSRGLPYKSRHFMIQILRNLWIDGCLLDTDGVYTVTKKGRVFADELLTAGAGQ